MQLGPVAPVKATSGTSPQLARALTRMRAEGARLQVTLDALLHSVERAQGGAQARDWRWVGAHRAAAYHHARSAAAQLDRMAPLRATVLRALGRKDVRVTPQQVRRAQAEIRRRGLPVRVRRALRAAGYTASGVAEFAKMTRTARPPARSVSLRVVLGDPRTRTTERNAIATLRRFAARAARVP